MKALERRAVRVDGVVQGVGFRPFVYALATRLALGGFVRNRAGSVLIEVEGNAAALRDFLAELQSRAPALAQIEHISWEALPVRGDQHFHIESSETAPGQIRISPDAATCADCLTELFDSTDRRYRYPFLNCTNCGPRLTIVTGAPYDRQRTTMSSFVMCPACQAEYDDPANRRFHAQPTCCPACGPRLQLLDGNGEPIAAGDPLAAFAVELRAGRIGALKGLGGYHLACDARSAVAVAELRRRKHRHEKPFALMVADVHAVEKLCVLSSRERELLLSVARPIVLLRRRAAAGVAAEVAPHNPFLGVMLPYTPLHHLLLRELPDVPLVMTSGNRSDEPIAYEDGDAVKRLAGIADLFLVHDRPIHVRCDDSVTRCVGGQELPVRRSRGYAPHPVTLPIACPLPILAVGGQLKGTFALGRDRHAIVSHHLGDLDHYEAYRAFVRDVGLYERLFAIESQVLAHDLHPDYASTRYARERGARSVAVQHHHAHAASCMAEHGLTGPVIGVTFDGTGYGTDGAIWGGEFLIADLRSFRRAAHFRYVGMPGGDMAIREPWRLALAHLLDGKLDARILHNRLPSASVAGVSRLLERGFHCPQTSSAGRLFDAVAVLAGLRERVSFEAQAAIELEWQAMTIEPDISYPFDLTRMMETETGLEKLVIDTRPLIRAVVADREQGVGSAGIARRFHSTMAHIIVDVCGQIRQWSGLESVVLSGGVFMNALLLGEVTQQLARAGFRVHSHRIVPPNDGGLSLGQLAVAAQWITR